MEGKGISLLILLDCVASPQNGGLLQRRKRERKTPTKHHSDHHSALSSFFFILHPLSRRHDTRSVQRPEPHTAPQTTHTRERRTPRTRPETVPPLLRLPPHRRRLGFVVAKRRLRRPPPNLESKRDGKTPPQPPFPLSCPVSPPSRRHSTSAAQTATQRQTAPDSLLLTRYLSPSPELSLSLSQTITSSSILLPPPSLLNVSPFLFPCCVVLCF